MKNIAWLLLFLSCAAPAAAAMPGPDDAIAVSGIVQQRLKATDIDVQMIEERPYMIAHWKAGKGFSAGQALAKKAKAGWVIVKLINRKFTLRALTGLGVAPKTAKALIADLKVAGQ